ncbi:MAG: hypothetical protein FD165_849 [Gammaproteobacteria bacterium]|nr:MAG: hypothetical protein FD165_849 [Gammaproteobacteria bacterium]TND06442.1 MAG: hypothetical protein FD120_929 [Gammaproteobacteria bacterium]
MKKIFAVIAISAMGLAGTTHAGNSFGNDPTVHTPGTGIGFANGPGNNNGLGLGQIVPKPEKPAVDKLPSPRPPKEPGTNNGNHLGLGQVP